MPQRYDERGFLIPPNPEGSLLPPDTVLEDGLTVDESNLLYEQGFDDAMARMVPSYPDVYGREFSHYMAGWESGRFEAEHMDLLREEQNRKLPWT